MYTHMGNEIGSNKIMGMQMEEGGSAGFPRGGKGDLDSPTLGEVSDVWTPPHWGR